MHTIAIVSQKGGTGKTTLALNLAVASESKGKAAVVIDLDPQASAKAWHDGRASLPPVVISAQAARITEVIETAEQHGAALTIIDTAPHSGNAALAAARVADLVLIPCRPGIFDLRAMASSVDICALAKVQAFAVLNAVPPRGSLPDEAEQAIKSYGVPVCPVRLSHRMAYVHSLTAGQTVIEFEPKGKASEEIRAIHKWVIQHVDMQTC